MSPFGLKFSQIILHTETSKLMYNWSFLFEVLHKPTLLPSTFKFMHSLSFCPQFIAQSKGYFSKLDRELSEHLQLMSRKMFCENLPSLTFRKFLILCPIFNKCSPFCLYFSLSLLKSTEVWTGFSFNFLYIFIITSDWRIADRIFLAASSSSLQSAFMSDVASSTT